MKWSAEEKALLARLYKESSAAQCADALGRPVSQVYSMASAMGIRKSKEWRSARSIATRTSRHVWTPEMVDRLRAMYPQHSAAECAAAIGLTVSQVHAKANSIGLRKSREWIAAHARAVNSLPGHGGRDTRFKPGQPSWNKGRPHPSTGRTVETQFKPGHKPHTWLPVGTERVRSDGYLERKVRDTGVTRVDFVPVHRLVWIEHHGEIPRGCSIVFRDGDQRNFDIENLECVTRAEIMRRNTIHNYPKPIAELVHLRGVLTRQINKRSESNEQ